MQLVEGWFRDTLPPLRGREWALVRLDGDMYESTMDGLTNLYPGLAPGGFLIVDDYGLPPCREAVEDYRREHGITEKVHKIDWVGAYWRKRGATLRRAPSRAGREGGGDRSPLAPRPGPAAGQAAVAMTTATEETAAPRTQEAPVAIEVRDLDKTFRIAEHRIDTFKERALHPFARGEYRELRPLRGISFDVRQGEFFGIAGVNGSGKSTLLKILASIYRADAGTIRMAGRHAPFIELGVGFKPEFTARENIVLNGVMMGLSRREAQRSVDAVLDFAELREFSEMKLKNYSSGMTVRLAFAVMIQADADILLIDEVLAVGDAAFAQKCADVFHGLKDGRQDGRPRHP